MKPTLPTLLFLLAAAAGLLFAGISTYDFALHLDRQLHGIHCSLLPGVGGLDASGATGCHAALMSPWSSVLRTWTWGGIPVALPGMAVFAFLLFRGLELWLGRAERSRNATSFLVLASLVPVLASVGMAVIAVTLVGEICTLCAGIYGASLLAFVAAVLAWRGARRESLYDDAPAPPSEERSLRPFVLSAAEGVAFVVIPVLTWALLAPDASAYVGTCGSLARSADTAGVLVPLDDHVGVPTVVEVLDPLCPACRGFETRFQAGGFDERVHRVALLMPLDDTCNWMVGDALHPGACALSEAVLCAGEQASDVLAWAFAEQPNLRQLAAGDPGAVAEAVKARFPEVAGCVGRPAVRNRLNKALRWAVANQLPVLMPQVFVDGVKLCDEDTDLGLDFALDRMLDQAAAGTLVARDPGEDVSQEGRR